MPMTPDELDRIIRRKENARVEFKAQLSKEVLRGLSTDIAAFANSGGGRIIFGVTDDRDPVGLTLKGDEGERISQEASNCRPAVPIDLEEISFGKRRFLIVQVPHSSLIHNDVHRKFPVRIGKITDYLDALGLVALLRERRLLIEEGEKVQPVPEKRERRPLTDSQVSSLSKVLTAKDPFVRLEGLKDLVSLPYNHVVFEHSRIVKSLEDTLKSGTDEELGLLLNLVRTLLNSGTDKEKEAITPWLERVAEIARSAPPEVARTAFEVLQIARDRATVRILVHWITNADSERYESLAVPGSLHNIKFYGLDFAIREAMYSLLNRSLKETARERVADVLKAVRDAYG